jgi:hypothetical protein
MVVLLLLISRRCQCPDCIAMDGKMTDERGIDDSFGVCLEEKKKTMKKLGQDRRCLGPDSKRAPLEYKSIPLPLRQPAYSWNHNNIVASRAVAGQGPRSKQRDGGRCCASAW